MGRTRNLLAAPADEEARLGAAAQGGAAAQTPHRDGAARPMPGNGNKRQRPNPRPDLKRGREAEDRAVRRAARPSHTEMNTRSKRRLEALSRRYPGKLELRAPQGATPVTLRMQALTAARFDDILAHVSFLCLRGRAARIAVCIPCGIRHRYGTRGISHPQPGRRLRAPPNNPTAANGPGGRWGV